MDLEVYSDEESERDLAEMTEEERHADFEAWMAEQEAERNRVIRATLTNGQIVEFRGQRLSFVTDAVIKGSIVFAYIPQTNKQICVYASHICTYCEED